MKLMPRLAACLAAALIISPSNAAIGDEPGSVAQLYSQCKNMVTSLDGGSISQDSATMIGIGVCSGYLLSYKDSQMFMPHSSPMHTCIPTDAS